MENKKGIKIADEVSVVLSDSKVQDTILKTADIDTLRDVFRNSPKFFQKMFSNKIKILGCGQSLLYDIIINKKHLGGNYG